MAVQQQRMRFRGRHVEVFRGRDKQFYFRVRAGNGRTISTGEAYTKAHDAVRGGRRANPTLPVVYGNLVYPSLQ